MLKNIVFNTLNKNRYVTLPPACYFSKSVSHSFSRRTNFISKSFRELKFGKYEVIESPGNVLLPPRSVPQNISKPPYGIDELPPPGPSEIEIKNSYQIDHMRASCSLARQTLNFARDNIQIGITTEELDVLIHNFIVDHGAYPSPLHYKNFPKSVCTSVNNVVCHGVPDDRQLQDGDIINVDVTVYLNGFHGDCSETFLVGNVDDQGKQLVAITKQCLEEAVKICHPERPFKDIGAVIEAHARRNRLTVVPSFIGHGIGEYFHGPPEILHYRNRGLGQMKAGMIFTIEPAISQGSRSCVILEDGWTALTEDGSRSAQFESTVLITDDGVEVLTV